MWRNLIVKVRESFVICPVQTRSYLSHTCGGGHLHLPPSSIVAKNGFAGSRLSRVITPQLPGMQGANPVFVSRSMQHVPSEKLHPNFTAWTEPGILCSADHSALMTVDVRGVCQEFLSLRVMIRHAEVACLSASRTVLIMPWRARLVTPSA